ncbi:MAG: glycosyltransferase family 39 protein [Lewinella sp.]|nr:glycosyltransferase family 39 protein [Lewinella sp.]
MRSTNRTIRNVWFPAFVLLATTLVFRFFSFFPTVINHDESTYILIGREILHGRHYFVDVIDTKPIGIFLIYALFQWLVGNSIFIFRILVAIGVAFTAFGLFVIVDRYLGNRKGAWIAGLGYVFMTAIFTYYGVSPNTELFFNGFTVVALWLILAGRHWLRFPLVGLALGLGFMIKYVVAFDALAFGLLVLWLAYKQSGRWWAGLGSGLLMLVFFMIPFALTYQYYALLGYESEFLYYTFEVPGRYPVDRTWWEGILYYLDFIGRFFPITLIALYTLYRGREWLGKYFGFFIIWLLLDGFIIGWPGKSFGHYFIQWMLPFCLLAGIGVSNSPPFLEYLKKIPGYWRWGVTALLALGLLILQKKDYYDKWDHPKEVAEYLSARMQPGDQLYTGNYHHILYFLLEKETPTPYVHRTLLWEENHRYALGIDLEKETRQILALRPRFLTLEYIPPPTLLADSLYKYYEPIEVIGDRITIYEHR